MFSKTKALALILLATYTSQLNIRPIDDQPVIIGPVQPIDDQPIILVAGPEPVVQPIEQPIDKPVNPIIKPVGPIKSPPIIITPPVKNPCYVYNCRCIARDGMHSDIYMYCPDNTQNCLSNYGECKPNKDGNCEFATTFSPVLTQCLNKSNYCTKSGCGLEECKRDLGLKLNYYCPTIPTYRHCYEDATCGVNKRGECEYSQDDTKLQRCLARDKLENLPTKLPPVTGPIKRPPIVISDPIPIISTVQESS